MKKPQIGLNPQVLDRSQVLLMPPPLDSLVTLPPDAVEALRRAVPSASGRPARISYLVGPGDPFSTYKYWKKGEFDPGVPSIAYSTMFYELVSGLGAKGQIIQRGPQSRPPLIDGEFRFDTVRLPLGKGFLGYHASRFHYARACLTAIKDFDPDIAVVASDFDWQYLPFVKNLCRRTVLSLHNTIWPMGAARFGIRQKAANAAISFWLRSINAAVCTSHECERQLKHLSKGRIATFVEAPQQVARPETPPLKRQPDRLIYLGRIEAAKGIFDLLEAFAELRDQHPALTLVFAGGGGGLETLKQRVDAMGVGDAVRVLGHIDAARAHKELAGADILICPTRTSFNEGLAFVCFEAALHGVPSVMSSVVPARDLLGDGCVVFESDSQPALKNALAGLLDDDARYRSVAANALARSEVLFDRSLSWGAQLFRAITAA